jgi:phosphoribosylaminoimidazole-succinocarboxamide synthase
MKKILFFVSGKGTNLDYIYDKINSGELTNSKIIGVLSNRDCLGLANSIKKKLSVVYRPWDKQNESREKYDRILLSFVETINPDLIVLAGWDHILGSVFINNLGNTTIINLHPALINTFPGNNAIEDAWNAYQIGRVNKTGIMVHIVTNKLDIGDVIAEKEIAIKQTDTLQLLEERIKYNEKSVLLEAINKLTSIVFKTGKVKDIYNIDNNRLLIMHTDRLSSCNKVVCELEGKGHLLSNLTDYWFSKTKDIIDNHVIEQKHNYIVAKKCTLIPVEFIVRGYITGSMWKKYSEGKREFCGNTLPENLKQYQKLKQFILTPTTKDENDLPINYQYILDNNILSKEELDYIYEICFKLFVFGQYECSINGLIMCDTKYEFGKTKEGKIILIDEIHTIESTRYWKKNSYETRLSAGLAPENLDKDIIRDYVKKGLDVPKDVLETLLTYYRYVYETLSDTKIDNIFPYNSSDIKNIIDKYNNIKSLK